jgi:hypothetical protein
MLFSLLRPKALSEICLRHCFAKYAPEMKIPRRLADRPRDFHDDMPVFIVILRQELPPLPVCH